MQVTRVAAISLLAMAMAAGAAGGAAAQEGTALEPVTVAVTAIVEHPALDAARDGVKAALEEAGYVEGETLTFQYESAQGNPATAAQIAQKFAGEAPDVIVAIATPSAQAAVAATTEIPIVFTAVTDPLGANIVTDLNEPGGNVTGLSDMSPLADHLDLIREFLPEAETLGVPYNPGEANAVTLVSALKAMAGEHGFEIVEAPATRSADVQAAAQSLIGKVDAIYVPTDNTIVSALEVVLQIGIDNQLPVFSGDTDSVVRGAVASVGFDYYQIGLQTGAIVLDVLNGTDPGSIPVAVASGSDLFVNPAAADAMGVALPEGILERAHTVVE